MRTYKKMKINANTCISYSDTIVFVGISYCQIFIGVYLIRYYFILEFDDFQLRQNLSWRFHTLKLQSKTV
ncbi:hypothetical protein MCETHM1_01489 [Flavobacteriaceae bacterium]|jgi:hypothetical protein